ncbi:putative metal-dependent membrane protease [Desulfitobacterium dichloroeliminans LMG P-21439]|uniref:Putative metal-dependent membrane protease n=1 Tax=Desulfitobacterium dichloroeliminans (strain LMG P-21439 / DCA1) TaxID=871963 RepID=L0F9I1_DESDL|nr:CPBP family intramembrane glutamic endopeptidase [Desulfitobacterium dichloroeliminans]AGA69675.1 putative metal-dependent membrane protease [Desulfitobacterium dichloroeliminans LMG P-21439]
MSNREDDHNQLQQGTQLRAALLPSFWLTQLLLLIPGGGLLWLFYLRTGYSLQGFFSWDNAGGIWIIGTVVAILGMVIQLVAWRVFPVDAFDDGGVNQLLLELPSPTLGPMFLVGAFSEELLVRGVLQTGLSAAFGPIQGIFFTSILFTAMHIRYLKKPVLMSGVFLISLILCTLYGFTGTLWATVWAHFLYNLGASILAKKYYLPYLQTSQTPKK